MCMQALEKICKGRHSCGFDVGCGSGISIAATKLGAEKKTVGVDQIQ